MIVQILVDYSLKQFFHLLTSYPRPIAYSLTPSEVTSYVDWAKSLSTQRKGHFKAAHAAHVLLGKSIADDAICTVDIFFYICIVNVKGYMLELHEVCEPQPTEGSRQ